MQLTINGTKLYVEVQGEGFPLVLLHGFPLDHRMWERQISALKQHYRIIAPDFQGMGRSATAGRPLTLDDYAADTLAVMDALHIEKAALGGFSMGGYVAFSLLRQAPERFAALLLANTKAEADTRQGRQTRMALAAALYEKGSVAAREAMLPKLLAELTKASSPELVKELTEMMDGMDAEGLVLASVAMAFRRDAAELLPSVRIPALVIAGAEDTIAAPEVMQKLAELLPSAEYHVIPQAAHLAPIEQPDSFNRLLLAFLDKATLRSNTP